MWALRAQAGESDVDCYHSLPVTHYQDQTSFVLSQRDLRVLTTVSGKELGHENCGLGGHGNVPLRSQTKGIKLDTGLGWL